ncbi:hypothetical protein XENTR_v10024722 [Xenopus tropicalis]|nr:hypothetical protein XENTR_v10024722 [Xenopus tropicalis]
MGTWVPAGLTFHSTSPFLLVFLGHHHWHSSGGAKSLIPPKSGTPAPSHPFLADPHTPPSLLPMDTSCSS